MLESRDKRNKGRAWGFEPLECRTLLAAPTLIDVMVVYDANAKSSLNVTDAAIQKLIRQSIDSANQVHYNTGDNVVLRLVYTGMVSYTSTGSHTTDLSNLDSGLIPTVSMLRDTYGADLVSLITTPTDFIGGLANLLTNTNGDSTQAFSVISSQAIGPGDFVMAHEMGHNLGAGHERDNVSDPTPNPVFPYSFGYHFVGNSGNEYADIMSYQGLQLPYFSNPNITYQGQPLGQPAGSANAADLYDTFLLTAPKVAAYKATVVADTTAPTATLYQADVSGNKLTFSVRYQDDVSVNASTLGTGDVYVHTPEGFNLTAELVSLDRAGDGYAKIATYRVTLPNSNPPLSALTYFLNANQVKDIDNNTTPAGQILPNADFDIDSFSFQAARDTGVLLPPETRQISGNVSTGDTQDFYKVTVTQHSAFSAVLSGLSTSAQIFLAEDLNGDDVPDSPSETLSGTNDSGHTDRALSAALDPGTYYVLVQLDGGQAPTNYTLTVRSYVDIVAPTATLDAVDSATATSNLNFSVLFSDDQALDFDSIASFGQIAFNVTFNGGGGISGATGSPNSTTRLPNGQVSATYSVNLGQSLSNGTVALSIYSGALVTDAAGNALPTGVSIGSYKLAGNPLTVDNTAPTRSLSSAPQVLVPGGTTYDFVVAYKDNRGVLVSTLDNNDIVVTGPGGFSQAAQFIPGSSSLSDGGSTYYSTYRIVPPGGTWDWHDDGNYSIVLQAGQVTDAKGNAAAPSGAANPVGTFNVHVPFPGDADGDNSTAFADLVAVAQNYGASGRGQATGDFNFDGVVDFADLVIVAQNYGLSLPAATPGAAVSDLEAALPAVSAAAPATAAVTTASTPKTRPSAVTRPPNKKTPTRCVTAFAPPTAPKSTFGTTRVARDKNDILS